MKTTPRQIIDEEVKWDKTQTVISKTDRYGSILYMNSAFEQVSEYDKLELIGEPHNIIRHPDMPKVIFKILWEALKKEKNFHAIVKNLTRTGRYYWVITDFEIEKDASGEVTGYTGRRKAIPDYIVDIIEPLYKTLLEIEKIKGEKASEMYFHAFLKEEIKKDYDTFVVDLFQQEQQSHFTKKPVFKEKHKTSKLKKGLHWFFFGEYED